MDGSNELRQLATLLRMGATTARDIATIRGSQDAQKISALADQAEAMADSLDGIAAGANRDGVDWRAKAR